MSVECCGSSSGEAAAFDDLRKASRLIQEANTIRPGAWEKHTGLNWALLCIKTQNIGVFAEMTNLFVFSSAFYAGLHEAGREVKPVAKPAGVVMPSPFPAKNNQDNQAKATSSTAHPDTKAVESLKKAVTIYNATGGDIGSLEFHIACRFSTVNWRTLLPLPLCRTKFFVVAKAPA